MRYRHRSSSITALLAAACVAAPLGAQGRAAAPKPDYSAPAGAPYTAEEVTVTTPMGHTLAGTLTLPKSANRARRVGAIVTITGSGPEDRDEAIGIDGYRPFRQFADSLARRGIATLRMDDRGTGASKGAYKGATSADFGEDIRAGLAYLRTRPEIDTTHLGLLGHSEGAIIAPIVALKEPNLRAIVLLAGVARPAREVLDFQMKNNINHNARLLADAEGLGDRRDSAGRRAHDGRRSVDGVLPRARSSGGRAPTQNAGRAHAHRRERSAG